MTARRSAFLFHWTGKKITTDPNKLTEEARHEYVELLNSMLKGGLWLSWCLESVRRLQSGHSWGPRMACFTETRLSAARDHTGRYGLLGLGFSREFVLRYHGAPVHYIRGRPPETLMEDLSGLTTWIDDLRKRFAGDPQMSGEGLENFYRAYHLLAFMKPMTEARSLHEDFELLHEHEWRIITPPHPEDRRQLRLVRARTEAEAELWAVPLEPGDVRYLITPDEATQDLILQHEEIQTFFSRAARPPCIMTVSEASEL